VTSARARQQSAASVVEQSRAAAAPPPPPPSTPPAAPPTAAEQTFRLTVDVSQVRAAQVKALTAEAAQVRGWRRANVGDLLAALVEQLLDDAGLQRKVIASMSPPAGRRKRN
jgi:hypothetical protein